MYQLTLLALFVAAVSGLDYYKPKEYRKAESFQSFHLEAHHSVPVKVPVYKEYKKYEEPKYENRYEPKYEKYEEPKYEYKYEQPKYKYEEPKYEYKFEEPKYKYEEPKYKYEEPKYKYEEHKYNYEEPKYEPKYKY